MDNSFAMIDNSYNNMIDGYEEEQEMKIDHQVAQAYGDVVDTYGSHWQTEETGTTDVLQNNYD